MNPPPETFLSIMQDMTMFKSGSSPVDWCEGNYHHSPFIAEFANTMSNILFFAFPPMLIHLFVPYGRLFNKGIHVIWIMLFVVGACSAYFHATLSLLGQLLDEIAILWVVATGFALWFPDRLLPQFFKSHRQIFQFVVLTVAILSSGLAFLKPIINAFALMSLGIPAGFLLFTELKGCHNTRVVRLGVRCGAMWVLAITCWINDRLFCETWSNLNFPYLHAVWHILIFIASYTGCVLFAYFDAKHQVPEQRPELKYWPTDRYEVLGVPYVGISGFTLGVDQALKQHLI